MKKFLVFLISMLFFASGCVSQDSSIRIKYSTWGSKSEIVAIKELIAAFEKENPNIKVDLIHIPDNYFQKLHLLIASNLAPDVIFINNLNAKLYVEAQKFLPLTSYFEKSENLKTEDFLDKAFIPFSEKGAIFAVPRDISNLVVYYNKDLFDKYNIPYPNDNWTMNDFLKTAQRLTNPEHFGVGFEDNSLFWLPFLWSNGGGILSDDLSEIILTEPASIEALQFYADLRNKYNVAPKKHEQASLTTSQLFLHEKVAMHLCGRWCGLTYKNNAAFNWDVTKFPSGKNGSVVGLDASGWAISADSSYKDEAWKFIEFMASDKSIAKFTEEGLILPSKKQVANSNIFLNPPPENAKVFITAIEDSKSTPVNSKYSEILDILNESLEPLFNGKITAEEAINSNLRAKLEKLIK